MCLGARPRQRTRKVPKKRRTGKVKGERRLPATSSRKKEYKAGKNNEEQLGTEGKMGERKIVGSTGKRSRKGIPARGRLNVPGSAGGTKEGLFTGGWERGIQEGALHPRKKSNSYWCKKGRAARHPNRRTEAHHHRIQDRDGRSV